MTTMPAKPDADGLVGAAVVRRRRKQGGQEECRETLSTSARAYGRVCHVPGNELGCDLRRQLVLGPGVGQQNAGTFGLLT